MSEVRERSALAILGIIAAILVVIGLLVMAYGAWQLNWFYTNQNITRTNHAIQNGLAYQTGQLTALENSYSTVVGMAYQIQTAPKAGQQALIDQRLSTAGQACQAAANITTITIPQADKTWVAANCSGSSVKAGSSLRKGS